MCMVNAVCRITYHSNALCLIPFKKIENIDVSLIQRASRICIYAVIEYQLTTVDIHVICIHLILFQVEKEFQLIT